jgi:hypothetical protein
LLLDANGLMPWRRRAVRIPEPRRGRHLTVKAPSCGRYLAR